MAALEKINVALSRTGAQSPSRSCCRCRRWRVADPDRTHGSCRLSRQRGTCPGKARTAALFKKPSEALEDAINHGRVAAVTAQGFTEMQGGLPIVVDGEVIGAIGVSFDTPEHDVQIAQAGLAAVPH